MRRSRWCRLRALALGGAIVSLPPLLWLRWMNETNEDELARQLPDSWKPALADGGLYGRSQAAMGRIFGTAFWRSDDGEARGFTTERGWYYLEAPGERPTAHGLFRYRATLGTFEGTVACVVEGRYRAGEAEGEWTARNEATGVTVTRVYRNGRIAANPGANPEAADRVLADALDHTAGDLAETATW